MQNQKAPKGYCIELTLEDRISIYIFSCNVQDLKRLRRNRMDDFDENGMVSVKQADGTITLENGRKFITDLLDFFVRENEAYCYRLCATLKPVLDEYNEKFPVKS